MIKVLTTIASLLTIGFGLWHFTVPKVWRWYSYIDKQASELVLAVRATNIFFSLSLVLFGVINLLFLYCQPKNTFALKVVIGASAVLWLVRSILQIIYPQGSMNPYLQYGMLAGFISIFFLYTISLILVFKGA